MSTPTTTDPPYVPLRRSGWPVRRMPLWGILALVVLAGAAVLVALSHKPSHAEQASDLNAYLRDMNAAIESCAGGVGESQQALSAVEAGANALLLDDGLQNPALAKDLAFAVVDGESLIGWRYAAADHENGPVLIEAERGESAARMKDAAQRATS